MASLIKRRIELEVDTIAVNPELRISGKATKTYKPEPNTCEVKVYGLSPEHRAQLTQVKTPLVKLAAGYGTGREGMTQLFYGKVLFVSHEVLPATGDIVTTLSTTDGGVKKQSSRVNINFGPKTKTSDVLRRIVQALGLNPGNSDKVGKLLDAGKSANLFVDGAVVSGSAANELSHLLRSCGYEWSIQDETLQLRKIGAAADGFAIELNPSTGLIGSPAISNKGVLSGQCLLFKAGAGLDLVPGRLARVSSAFVSGQFILAKTDFDFDNYSDQWYCNFQAVTKKGDLPKIG